MKKLSKLQKRKLKILEDTVKYYGENPAEKRCITKGRCSYSGDLSGKNTDGCAVGRLLHPKRAAKFDRLVDTTNSSGGIQEFFEYSYKMIPPRLRRLGSKFLTELQILHDTFDRNDPEYLYKNIKEKIILNKI